MKLKNFALASVFLCLAFAIGVRAQIDLKATIKGQVMRTSKRGIRYAQVTVLNLLTLETETRMTNDSGYYSFNDLPFGGYYYVTVKAKNYEFPYTYGTTVLSTPVQELLFVANR